MLAGMLLGVLLYRPIFNELYQTADVAHKNIVATASETHTSTATNATITTVMKNFDDSSRLKTTVTKTATSQVMKDDVMLNESGKWKMILLIGIMVLFVTMVYGPNAAFLVELFPTKIRYTSMSLPYHIGNGVFGGLTPFVATLLTTIYTADKLVGLMYPIIVAALCMVIGFLYINNNTDPDVQD